MLKGGYDMLKVEFEGFDKLRDKLNPNKYKQQLRDTVRVNGAELDSKAKKRAPVDTGNLRREIRTKLEDDGLTSTTTSNADYSVYVEYGTRKQTAQPFMRPSFEEQKDQFVKDIKNVLKGG